MAAQSGGGLCASGVVRRSGLCPSSGTPPVEFPYTGNRTAVWIVAQLHTLFGAFILGAPIFIVISEWLGYRKQDLRYDRLAKEVTKVTVILFSMTALTGGLFIFVLLATYPQFTTWFINHFYLVFAVIYPLLFISGTIVLYMYFYMWDAWKGEKKGRHIALGVLLNLICMITMFVIDGPTSFMNTPPKAEGISPQEFLETATLWDKIANLSWMPLNLHRIDGNVAFGGFVTGMIAAYMYMGAKNQEERAYYDWMGFVGNLIAVGATLFQPFTGLLLAYEMCDYDFSFCPYMMADQLSMFFEMQGAMIGLMFLAINYYVWLSLKRIEGVEKVRMTILAPIVMVAFPFVMMMVMTYYWIPDPMSLAFLLPLVLAPFILGRFIPYDGVCTDCDENRLFDGRSWAMQSGSPPTVSRPPAPRWWRTWSCRRLGTFCRGCRPNFLRCSRWCSSRSSTMSCITGPSSKARLSGGKSISPPSSY